ncbi:MAG: hypothetical protein COB02_06305 [Candidatus Cloacimonadota bacterium]|nr:MAG: hypothetical protein COB02_06305 [Candidatus Cloacimonadota bacterium]
MLHLNLNSDALDKLTQQSIKRLEKKLEKELLYHPGVDIFVDVSAKGKKQYTIQVEIEYRDEIILNESFQCKSWISALDQYVQHAIWTIKRETPRKVPLATMNKYQSY